MNRALMLGVVMGGTTMGLMDIVAVNIALPRIMMVLGASELVSRAAKLVLSPGRKCHGTGSVPVDDQ